MNPKTAAPFVTLCFVLADVLWQEWLVFGLFLRRPRLLTLPPISALPMILHSALEYSSHLFSWNC